MVVESRPRLAKRARLRFDRATQRWILLAPARGLVLSWSASAVLMLCTGERSLAEIVDQLAAEHHAPRARLERDVLGLMTALETRGLVEVM